MRTSQGGAASTTPSPPWLPGDMVSETGDMAARVVEVLRLRRPRVQWVLAAALAVFMLVCVAAVITRTSAWPLLPLASFGIASLAAWRARGAAADRQVVGWTLLVAVGVALGFWLLGIINRMW